MIRHTLHKTERLKSKKYIKELFDKGSSFYSYPVKLFFYPAKNEDSSQLLVTVPKRKIRRAVDRNKIKRRIREAYRLNKPVDKNLKSYYFAIVYLSDKIEDYSLIESKLKKLFARFAHETSAKNEKD